MAWSMRDNVEGLGLRPVVVASTDETLRSVARTLWLEDVGAVVVKDGDRPVGILTERDLVRCAAHGEDLDSVRVGDAMTTNLIAVRPQDTVQDAAYQMLGSGIRHLPVEDETGRLLGMISIRDLLRPWMAGHAQDPPG